MKKILAVLACVMFAFAAVGVNAQPPQAPAKKEATKKEKKEPVKKVEKNEPAQKTTVGPDKKVQ